MTYKFEWQGVVWELVHPRATMEHLGALPSFLSINDPRGAEAQFNERYVFGGWRASKGFKGMTAEGWLSYPGDPVMKPFARAWLRSETIFVYASSFVGIRQEDGTYTVARLD